MDLITKSLMNYSPVSRTYAHGFLTKMLELVEAEEKVLLRQCQEAGRDKCVELQDFMPTPNSIRTWGANMKHLGIFDTRRGRMDKKFTWFVDFAGLDSDQVWNAVVDFIDMDLNTMAAPRSKTIGRNIPKDVVVRTDKRRRFEFGIRDRGVWNAYWAAYKAGLVDIAFVHPKNTKPRIISRSEYVKG